MNRNHCAPISTRRRSNWSAIAPASSESSITGSAFDAWTSAIMLAGAESSTIIHAAPTPSISPPKLEPVLAIHTARQVRWRNGRKDRTDGGLGKGGSLRVDPVGGG